MLKTASLSLLALLLLGASPLPAGESKLGVKADEEIGAVLQRLVGTQVQFRLRSGENIGGRLELAESILTDLASQDMGKEAIRENMHELQFTTGEDLDSRREGKKVVVTIPRDPVAWPHREQLTAKLESAL